MIDSRPATQAIRAAGTLVLMMMLAGRVPAETFTVTSSSNSGTNTLRWAIDQANTEYATQHNIEFSVTQVNITTPLPEITRPVQINEVPDSDNVTITGGANAGDGLVFDIPSSETNFSKLNNVTIEDFAGSGVVIDSDGSGNIELELCTIYNNGAKGVLIQSSEDADVANCTISDNGSRGIDVRIGGKDCFIYSCTINGNSSTGVYLYDGSTATDDIAIVRDCQITDNGAVASKGGVQIWNSGSRVNENHIYENFGPGVKIGMDFTTDNEVRENNIFLNSGKGIQSASDQSPPVLGRFSIDETGGTVTIPYTIDATGIPNETFYVDFYVSDDDGEGAAWLGYGSTTSGSPGGILSGEATVPWNYSYDYPPELAGNYTLDETELIVATVSRGPGDPDTSEFSAEVDVAAEIADRYVFYNNSSWDDTSAAEPEDDDAIATDKEALLPGETAEFKHYTSYVSGLNGIMIDIHWTEGAIDASDFVFKVGNDDNPGSWATAPAPIEVDVRSGAGVDGSDRITIIWADSAIRGEWLQVTMLANADTCLNENDVFYFGNAPGETGDSATDAIVDATDITDTRNHPHPFFDPAPIDCNYDFNRDKRGNSIDVLIARSNQTTPETALQLIDP